MFLTILILFVAVITFGLYMVVVGVRLKKRLPKVGLLHAALAIAGTTLLFVYIFDSASEKLNNIAAFFLLLAIIGGGLVFALHEHNKPPVMVMVVLHAIMGLVGVSFLMARYFNN